MPSWFHLFSPRLRRRSLGECHDFGFEILDFRDPKRLNITNPKSAIENLETLTL